MFWYTIVCTGVPVWQPAADIRDLYSSLSPLCWHHDTAGTIDSSSYPWRSRLFDGCSAGMEQSATRDSDLLLTFDIPKGDQVSPFSSVIWLTWCCPLWQSADVCIELCNSFRCRFCKVPPQLCDGSTIIVTFVIVVLVTWRHCIRMYVGCCELIGCCLLSRSQWFQCVMQKRRDGDSAVGWRRCWHRRQCQQKCRPREVSVESRNHWHVSHLC